MDILTSCRDLNELHPKVKVLAEALISECKKQNILIGISETYRTVERQDYLYAQGRTRPGRIVTHSKGSTMSSYHQWRLAFDVYHNKRGDEYNSLILSKVGAIGQNLGLEWGGSWSKFRDTPHFQYTFGLSINDLRAGKKPPSENQKKSTTVGSKEDIDYKKAVDILQQKGIIGTPSAWYPEPNSNHIEELIKNAMPKIVEEISYELQIQLLNKIGIISSTQIWLDKNNSKVDTKAFMKKIADLLKDK